MRSPRGQAPWGRKILDLCCICLVFISYVQAWLFVHGIVHGILRTRFKLLTNPYSGEDGLHINNLGGWAHLINVSPSHSYLYIYIYIYIFGNMRSRGFRTHSDATSRNRWTQRGAILLVYMTTLLRESLGSCVETQELGCSNRELLALDTC